MPSRIQVSVDLMTQTRVIHMSMTTVSEDRRGGVNLRVTESGVYSEYIGDGQRQALDTAYRLVETEECCVKVGHLFLACTDVTFHAVVVCRDHAVQFRLGA